MNNLSSYFGLVHAKIVASDKDLPVLSLVAYIDTAGWLAREGTGIMTMCQGRQTAPARDVHTVKEAFLL